MRDFLRRYNLGVVLAAMFLASWGGQLWTSIEMKGPFDLVEFWKDTLENWQSEFLQVLVFVVLTKYLVYDGSKESKSWDERKRELEDES